MGGCVFTSKLSVSSANSRTKNAAALPVVTATLLRSTPSVTIPPPELDAAYARIPGAARIYSGAPGLRITPRNTPM